MGFLNDVLGTGSSKPRVTSKEYKKVKGELFNEGFNRKQRAKVDQIFAPDYNMAATSSHPKGLEGKEIDARMKWMRAPENRSKHGFSTEKINEIEASLKKRL